MSAKDASGTWRVETGSRTPHGGVRAHLVAALIGGLVLAAGVGTSFAVHRYAASRVAEAAGWHGKVVRIATSGPEGVRGLTVVTQGVQARATEGAGLRPGSTLTTDSLTRARVALDDGTELVLDRSTQVVILPAPRSLRLEGGQIGVEVSGPTGAPGSGGVIPGARFSTPEADIATSGAKLVLTTIPGKTQLDVVRGAAVMTSGTERVEVGVGEAGVASAGAPLSVTGVPDLARRLAFTERVGEGSEVASAREGASTGLGELVARRPGKTDEKDRALHLSTHAATIRIAANVARTEVLEEFTNDTGDDLEGVYRFPLPPGADIAKLSLDVDGKMVPGSFVEKAKAAAIWRGAIQNAAPKAPKPKEEIIWVPGPWRDPALLEWNGGGRFELRIFPIPKHGSRRILLGYTETVPTVAGTRRYVYPLPERAVGTPAIDHFSLDVEVRGAEPARATGYDLLLSTAAEAGVQKFAMTADSFRPTGDLALDYSLTSDRSADVTAWAYADGRPADNGGDPFVALALRPKLPRWEHPSWRDQVIVVDGGHSMTGERFQKARKLAATLAAEMDRRDRVTVLLCDVTCRRLPEGWLSPGAPSASAVQAFLADVAPDGATDLVGAVRAAAALSNRLPANDLRVILLSSGFGGAGYRRLDRVRSEVASALEDGRAEVVAVPLGGDADRSLLGEIARGGGGVLVSDGQGQDVQEVAMNVLGATYGATLRDVTLTLPEGFYDAPAGLSPMRAGSEQIAAFRMRGERVQGEAVLRGKVGGQPFEARYPLDVRASNEPGNAFVPRVYAKERIVSLERNDGEAARPELVKLSQRYSVPCRYTSLLVLESEAMFQAFGIERAKETSAFTGESVANASFARSPDADAPGDDLARTPSGGGAAPAEGRRASLDGFGSGGMLGASSAEKGSSWNDKDEAQLSSPAKSAHAPLRVAPAPPAASAASSVTADLAPTTATVNAAAPALQPVATRPVGRWMRREWFRGATIGGPMLPASTEKLAAARAALAAAPNDRAKYKELARWLALDGSLSELEEVVESWARRDPFDADAVAARSDILARRGRRIESLRVLSGVLGTIKAMPATDEAALDRTLARAYGRAGRPESCSFWVGAAELAPQDVDSVAHAAACERTGGRPDAAGRWLAALSSEKARSKATPLVDQYEVLARTHEAPSDRATWGDLVVDASWDEGADLDIVIIDPTGARQSWSSRSGSVRVSDARSTRHEGVALTSYAAGPFMIEVVRADGAEGAGTIHGRVRIRALGGYDSSNEGAVAVRDFVLAGERTQVARVDVRWDSRLVPASAPAL